MKLKYGIILFLFLLITSAALTFWFGVWDRFLVKSPHVEKEVSHAHEGHDGHDDHGDHEEETHPTHASEKTAKAPESKHHDEEGHHHGEGRDHEEKHDHAKEENGKDPHDHAEEGKGHAEHEGEEGHEGHGHGEGEEEVSLGGVGKNNAVTAADEHVGIRLSEKAIAVIGLKTVPYSVGPVPKSSLVSYQDQVGIYRLRDGWFKLVPVHVQKSGGDAFVSDDLKPGDQVVVSGTGLLRAAELDAFSEEVAHSH